MAGPASKLHGQCSSHGSFKPPSTRGQASGFLSMQNASRLTARPAACYISSFLLLQTTASDPGQYFFSAARLRAMQPLPSWKPITSCLIGAITWIFSVGGMMESIFLAQRDGVEACDLSAPPRAVPFSRQPRKRLAFFSAGRRVPRVLHMDWLHLRKGNAAGLGWAGASAGFCAERSEKRLGSRGWLVVSTRA